MFRMFKKRKGSRKDVKTILIEEAFSLDAQSQMSEKRE